MSGIYFAKMPCLFARSEGSGGQQLILWGSGHGSLHEGRGKMGPSIQRTVALSYHSKRILLLLLLKVVDIYL